MREEGAEEEELGGGCTGSLGGSDSDVALLLPSPGEKKQSIKN